MVHPRTVFLIPPVAVLAVVLLGMTPWGSMYRTITGYSATDAAHVQIAGVHDAVVELIVVEHTAGAHIELTVTGESTESRTVEVPSSWNLQEVSGVHIRAVQIEERTALRRLMIPDGDQSLKFIFKADHTPERFVFSHDSNSPALFTLRQVTWPGKEVESFVQIVKPSRVLLL